MALRNKDLVINKNPKSLFSESIRSIRTNIAFASLDKEVKIIINTSPEAGDGKSFITANLAVAYAHYIGVEIPQVEKTYSVSELIGKEIRYHGQRVFITPYGNNWQVYSVSRCGIVKPIDRTYVVFESDICKQDE